MDYREIAVRAAKTFGQVFLAQVALSALDLLKEPSLSLVEKVAISAAALAASVVWNTVLVPAWDKSKVKLASLGK